jgi:hypothetical protein
MWRGLDEPRIAPASLWGVARHGELPRERRSIRSLEAVSIVAPVPNKEPLRANSLVFLLELRRTKPIPGGIFGESGHLVANPFW